MLQSLLILYISACIISDSACYHFLILFIYIYIHIHQHQKFKGFQKKHSVGLTAYLELRQLQIKYNYLPVRVTESTQLW